MSYSLAQVNALSPEAFVHAFGTIYEHSPWVAQQAATARPFDAFDQFLTAMQTQVTKASVSQQLALIRAHPELQGQVATPLTAESRHEQHSAGLHQCTPQEVLQLRALNRAYREKFGFPFIIAVRGLTRAEIITRMTTRLANDSVGELAACLAEVNTIAQLRLRALII